jgi:hypothetical protein
VPQQIAQAVGDLGVESLVDVPVAVWVGVTVTDLWRSGMLSLLGRGRGGVVRSIVAGVLAAVRRGW